MLIGKIYRDNYQLMSGIQQSGMPIPKSYLSATQFILNKNLHYLFEEVDGFDLKELVRLRGELDKWKVELSDAPALKLVASEWIYRELMKVKTSQISLEDFEELVEGIAVLFEMGLEPDVWQSQNLYFSLIKGYKSNEWVFATKTWEKAFFRLGDLLSVGL